MPSFTGLGLGSQLYVGIKKEGTRLTAETVPAVTLKVESNNVAPKNEYDVDNIQYLDRQSTYDKRISKQWVEGEIVGRINNEDIGHLLFYAFGSGGYSASTASGATTHTYTPQNKISTAYSLSLPSFTLFHSRGSAGNYYTVNGCSVNSLQLEIGETESKFTLSIMGIDEVEVTNSTAQGNIDSALSYGDPEFKFNFGHLVAQHSTNVSGLSSPTSLSLQPGLTITINNNLKADYSSTTAPTQVLRPRDFYAGKFEASVSFKGFVRDAVIYDAFKEGQFKAYRFILDSQNAGGTELGTSSALYPLVRITLPKATPEATFDTPLDEAISYSVELKDLMKTTSEAYAIQVVLQNESTTYNA